MKNKIINDYINQYKKKLTRLCLNLCGNYPDADDLFQETWIKVIKNFDTFDSSKDFEKWLFSICINTYKNNCRSFSRHNTISFASAEEKELFLSSIPDTDIKNEEYEQLLEIIGQLPEKYRIVLSLRYFNDYSEKDVAKILNIPVGTVKSRLNKAKQLIRRRFLL